MDLVWVILTITLCYTFVDSQDDQEAAVLQKDLQEYFRRLTQRPMQTTQNFHTAFVPDHYNPLLRQQVDPNEEALFPYPSLRDSFQSNTGREAHSFASASASASLKRPDADQEASAKSAAFSSLKDVDAEEHIGDDMTPFDKSSTFSDTSEFHKTTDELGKTTDELGKTTDELGKTNFGVTPEKSSPYTLKHRQMETTVIRKDDDPFSDVYFVAIVAGCCAVGIFGVISAGVCFYRLQKSQKAAADVDYPAYGVTGPCKDVTSPNGDRKLAQSAQMYHFQLQKQQMIAVEKAGSTKNTSASDVDSEEENEEGDYTVYECPGLAPTGEMEVKNPLFHDDSTPVSSPVLPD